MMLRTLGAYALTCGILLRGVAAQNWTLEGYRLGQRWTEIGRAMPCQQDSLPDKWAVKVKSCWPNGDSVRLWFVRDTLSEISYVPAGAAGLGDTLPAEVQWSRRWKKWSIARFGAPDSVTSSGTHTSQVTAFWHKGPTLAQVEIISAPGGHPGFVHVELCGVGAHIRCRSSWFGLQLVAS
jgi:hypothetical protein